MTSAGPEQNPMDMVNQMAGAIQNVWTARAAIGELPAEGLEVAYWGVLDSLVTVRETHAGEPDNIDGEFMPWYLEVKALEVISDGLVRMIDSRNPGQNPPRSAQLKAQAKERYGAERLSNSGFSFSGLFPQNII